jgi:hypothetical protein
MADIDIIKKRKRLFIDINNSSKHKEELIRWAATNEYDTIVFSLGEKLNLKHKYIKLAKRCNLNIEAGGRDFSLLLPRRLFFSNNELFRMEEGKRKQHIHFCPTNPKTTSTISEQAQSLFTGFLQVVTEPRVFHLLPDEGHENTWCACPACRAFTPCEQYIIAVNTAADALSRVDTGAFLGYVDYNSEPDKAGIAPRKNMVCL